MTIYESLLYYPVTSPSDKRLAKLERTCQELRKYHVKARTDKKPIIMRLVLRYEFTIERIKAQLEKGA